MSDAASDPETFLEYRLVRTGERLRRRFEEALRPHGLTARQFSVLAVLRARPDIVSADLARAVLTTPQSMGALLDQLEGAGYVEPRSRQGKGVRAPTRLSAAGIEVLNAATATIRAIDDATRAVIGPDLPVLLRALERLEGHLVD